MIFEVACRMSYLVEFPSTLILSVHAQQNASQQVLDEHFDIQPRLASSETLVDSLGNRFHKLVTGPITAFDVVYSARVDCDFEMHRARTLTDTPVAELDADAISYLFPSRYCESDRIAKMAWDLFGDIEKPYDKVVAICDWVHANVEYERGSTDSGTSACQIVVQRSGVCRDFAHLGIALCRALDIPARYFTGYAYELEPPDFHACFECFIGGAWLIFDPTHLAHLNGLVRIATGRDAADTAIASVFGEVKLTEIQVSCVIAADQRFVALPERAFKRQGVALPTSGSASDEHA